MRNRSRGEQVRLVAAFVLGGLVVLFAVLNLDDVRVNWIFFKSATPLIVVIVVCLLAGAALGAVGAHRRAQRSRAPRRSRRATGQAGDHVS
jgi:lipopolysaccharide assembly protein A